MSAVYLHVAGASERAHAPVCKRCRKPAHAPHLTLRKNAHKKNTHTDTLWSALQTRYALEDTSCINRFICPGFREWEFNVSSGAQAGGPLVAHYKRPLR